MDDNNRPAEPESYPLDEACISLLADIKRQLDMTVTQLNAQATGAVVLFIRQHGLKGNWKPADNGRELVKQPDQMIPA